MFRPSSSSRLSRSKSTSSVHSKHEFIDAQTARQHAHAAAQLAFARAQERTSDDQGHRRSQSKSATDRTSIEKQPCSQPAAPVEHVIKRQQSVRFAGSGAIHRRQSTSNRILQPAPQRRDSTATLRPIAMTTNASVPAAYRPPSRSSSIGKTSSDKPTAQSFATALAAYDEYYAREPELPSTPSSYRRLRKSKSLISPLRVAAAPHVFYTNGTPDRRTSSTGGDQDATHNDRTPETYNPHPALRAPKSMSFLRGRGGALRQRNDEAVQMARDRFFHHAAQERLRSQPSFLFRSRAQKNEKAFKKSVRSSSGISDALPKGSPSQDVVPKDSRFRDKARKASRNLKITLKKVFGRSKEEPVPIPNQQIDARETHVRNYSGGPDAVESTFVDIPYPDEDDLTRIHSRAPSVRVTASDEKQRSRPGSVRSVRIHRSHQSDDGSRVTSWTSTAVNTLNSQNMRAISEKERQRLSIINEIGTHNSSSSLKRAQVSAYPHVLVGDGGEASKSILMPVDSARVYSALMKRLDQNSPKAVPAPSRQPSTESLQSMGCTARQTASSNRGRQSQRYSTIRGVPHEDSIAEVSSNEASSQHGHDHSWVKSDAVHAAQAEDVFGYTGSHVHQWRLADPLRAARMRREDANDVCGETMPAPSQFSRANSNASRSFVSIQQPSNHTSFYTVPEDFEGRTPQEMAVQNEPIVIEPKRLRESRSTFFGGTSIISRTTSPYRRAMAEVGHNTAAPGSSPVAARLSIIPNPLYQSSENSHTDNDVTEDRISQKADSESIYSRTTSGHTLAANSALSLLIDEQPRPPIRSARDVSSTGDAIILERATYRPSMVSRISPHRATSSAGSSDWRRWMSSEVAKLERAKVNRLSQSYINYALPTMPKSFPIRHVRESAQYDDEEVGEGKAGQVELPLGLIQPQNANIQFTNYLKPILKKQSIATLNENSDPRHRSTSTIHIPLPPPIPDRSILRSTQSSASLRSVNTITPANSTIKNSSINGRHVLQKKHPSTTTLRSVKSHQSLDTPAKLVKKQRRLAPTSTGSGSGSLGAAVDKQLGTPSTVYRTPVRQGADFSRLAEEHSDGLYGIDGPGEAGLVGQDGAGHAWELSESDAQAMGSRKMVELFLNSRRRRIDGCSDEDGGCGGSAVFL